MTLTLIVIIVCLAIQRYLPKEIDKPTFNWIYKYYQLLSNWFGKQSWWQGVAGVVITFGVLVGVYILIISPILNFAGLIVTFLFNLAVLWYYLEARPLDAETAQQVFIPEILIIRYQTLFAVLFWYVLLGPLGIIGYGEVRKLELQLKAEKHDDVYFSTAFLEKLSYFRSLLDWMPIRLLGLTYALVGQFRQVFQLWLQRFASLNEEPVLVVDYGITALNWDPNATLSGSAAEVSEIEALTNRALCVWLAVIAIYMLGQLV